MKNRLACAGFVAALLATTSASAEGWEVTKLVPGSAFHGVHGLGIDKAGHLFAGSVAGAALSPAISIRARATAWPVVKEDSHTHSAKALTV